MFIKRLADHWSWGLVSSATVLFISFGGMVAHDLLNGLPVGTTIRESAVNADPFMLFFSFVASMMLVANIVWSYRHRHDNND